MVAEAMDTAQRAMGLDWACARELIKRSLAESHTVEATDLACGAGTDQLDPATARSLDEVIAAYEEQLEQTLIRPSFCFRYQASRFRSLMLISALT